MREMKWKRSRQRKRKRRRRRRRKRRERKRMKRMRMLRGHCWGQMERRSASSKQEDTVYQVLGVDCFLPT
jgi:hypothetical protein